MVGAAVAAGTVDFARRQWTFGCVDAIVGFWIDGVVVAEIDVVQVIEVVVDAGVYSQQPS
jgi:hypothetical protein